MIVTENLTINHKAFVRTYSDSGHMIERDGSLYDEAFDLAGMNYVYRESDILMPRLSEREAMDILLGGGL